MSTTNVSEIGTEVAIPLAVTVGATSIEVRPAANRKAIYIRNTSTAGQVITVLFSNSDNAVAGIGFVLDPKESIIDSDSEGYRSWTGRIVAISSAIGGTLAVFEK